MDKLAQIKEFVDSYNLQTVQVKPRGKAPISYGWQHLLPTMEDWRGWLSKSDFNVGIVTGSRNGLLAVDIDDVELFEKMLILHPTGVAVRSRQGGHLYFRYHADIHGRIGNINPHPLIHFRCENGMVIAPPSTHKTGFIYEWITQDWDNLADYDHQLQDREYINQLVDNSQQSEAPVDNDWHFYMDNPQMVHTGMRDVTAIRIAGGMIARGDDSLAVFNKLSKEWYPYLPDIRGFTLEDLSKKIESAIRMEKRKKEENEKRLSPFSSERSVVVNWQEFIQFPEAEDSWIIQDVLPSKTTGLIVGPPGSYKTWMVAELAYAISTGHAFLDEFEVLEKGPVLVIQIEDSRETIVQRFRTIADSRLKTEIRMEATGMVDEDWKNPVTGEITRVQFESHHVTGITEDMINPDLDVWDAPGGFTLTDSAYIEMLSEQIKKRQYKLVTFDPLYAMTSADNYMSKAPQEMMQLKYLRDTHGCSFMIAHHTKKSASDNAERMDAWGSQFLNAWIEAGWQLRFKDGDILWHRHFKSSSAKTNLMLNFNIRTDPMHEDGEGRIFEVGITEIHGDLSNMNQDGSSTDIDLLQPYMDHPNVWMTAGEAYARLKEDYPDDDLYSRATYARRLIALVENDDRIDVRDRNKRSNEYRIKNSMF